jgi:proline dehydrogenase
MNMFRYVPVLRTRVPRRPLVATALSLSFGALALHASSNDHQQQPMSSLLRAYLVFTLCSLPSLVDASPRIISFLSNTPVLCHVTDAFLKVTFFDQASILSFFSIFSCPYSPSSS